MRLALLALAILLGPGRALAAPWEVAVVFLGAREPVEYQQDVDQNMMELAKTVPGANLRLGILREHADRVVRYYPDPKSVELGAWDPLFHSPPIAGVQVPGPMKATASAAGKSVLEDDATLAGFFADVFREPKARRMLIVYGHGEGPSGMRVMRLKTFTAKLKAALPASLDILWLNTCFMANIETVYELRALAPYMIVSQEEEFTAGAPFEALQELESGPEDARAVAVSLGKSYLESYSYSVLGSQRRAVYKSSATISVVETARLEKLVRVLGKWREALGPLDDEERATLEQLAPSFSMRKPGLVDLGRLIVSARARAGLFGRAARATSELMGMMELGKPSRLMTNPRVSIHPEAGEAKVIFGYDGWSRGDKADALTLGKLPTRLKPMGFLAGPNGKEWPMRLVRKILFVAPFTVGSDRFDYAFVGEPAKSLVRKQDFYYREASGADNPLLLAGYTQGIGSRAERYTGLAVADPLLGVPNLDYLKLEFNSAAAWGGEF